MKDNRPAWMPEAAPPQSSIDHLIKTVPGLPDDYVRLIASADGGWADLAIEPWYVQFWSISQLIKSHESDTFGLLKAGYLAFGGNGGIETFAFRGNSDAGEVVMIDVIAGPESANTVCASFEDFLSNMCLRREA